MIAGILAGLTGCLYITNNTYLQPKPDESRPRDIPDGPPSGNSGPLPVPIGLFGSGNNGATCFPTSDGWDKFYSVPFFFVGPGVTPDSNCYTNSQQASQVTVFTCGDTNGTTLETGILIVEQFHPSTDKVCATNTPACPTSPRLTINQRAIATGKKYRATVFYKSRTLGSITNVTVFWTYP